jgi:hypothetical protein
MQTDGKHGGFQLREKRKEGSRHQSTGTGGHTATNSILGEAHQETLGVIGGLIMSLYAQVMVI